MKTIENTSPWDAIVVGAGLGGLSAAACLAATGQRTLLLERHSVLGGSSHVFRRKKKWEFDCGVHYIGDCGPDGQVPTLLRGLGLDERIEWLPLDRDGFDTIIGPDLELRVPVGWDRYLENLIRAFPSDERGLRQYVAVMRRVATGFDHSVDMSSPAAMARYAARTGWAAPWLMAPHIALMLACRLSPRTVLALSVIDGAVATTPQATPVAMVANLLNNFIGGGAWYPRGGGQILSAGFAEVIRSHGGEIRTQAHVKRIVVEGGAVKGVLLQDGELLRASAVVAAGDIRRTYRDLVGYEHLPRSVSRRSESWKMAHPVINACFGVEIDIARTPDSNFFVIPNWDGASSMLGLQRMTSRLLTKASGRDSLEWARDFARNQPGFVQCSTRRDPSSNRGAPAGHAAIEVQTMAPADPLLWGVDGCDIDSGAYRQSARYGQIKDIIAEGMLQRLERAYPGASAKVRWAELGTPASQERFTHTSGGAAMGIEPRISQFGPFRPGTRTAIRGLFLAGTSTAWGPGTEGSMLSGLHAASAITGRNLQAEIRAGVVLADRSRFSVWGPDFDPYNATRMLSRRTRRLAEDAAEEAQNSAPLSFGVAA
jgi:all-trans-retinol 13,14-reductase